MRIRAGARPGARTLATGAPRVPRRACRLPPREATDAAFGEAQRSGLRIFLGKVMMDRNAPESLLQSSETNVEVSRRLCRRWNGEGRGRLRYVFSPLFAPSCTFELLRGAATAAREQRALLQTHLSESRRELEWCVTLSAGRQLHRESIAAGHPHG